ncbi:MAG TPA: tetratricopeptide repeat protein, partial [Vicinamibacteria bacterium]|nr:tetratricopeptide repeat protein [Vicinamibacteria bacterium]
MRLGALAVLWWLLACLPAGASALGEGSRAPAIPPGVVVESVERGFVAERGGVRAGDVLVSWASLEGDRHGEIVSPLLLDDLELGELPRGPLVLLGTRAGTLLEATVDADAVGLGLRVRPRLTPALLGLYQRGRRAIDGGRLREGASMWREAAARARAVEGGRSAGCWLLGKAGDAWAIAKQAERAAEAYDDAVACAEAGDAREVATLLQWWADQAFELGQPQVTRAALEVAFGLLDEHPQSPPLAVIKPLLGMMPVHPDRQQVRREIHPYVLDLAERHAPDSLLVARVLLQVGLGQQLDGEFDAAEGTFTRAAEIAERAGPWSITCARTQTALGGLAGSRGDLVRNEDLFRKAAEQLMRQSPDSLDTGRALVNLGGSTMGRGDFEAGERWARAALRVLERLPTGRNVRAAALNNLSRVFLVRGDAAQAVTTLERVLADITAATPTSYLVAVAESNLGEALLARGDLAAARHHADRALAHALRYSPHSTVL